MRPGTYKRTPKILKKTSDSCKKSFVDNPERRARLSIVNKGKVISPETRKKISAGLTGFKRPIFTEEHRRNIGLSAKGRKVSVDLRNRIGLGLKKYYSNHIRLGQKPSAETRRKISEANRGEKSYLWRGGITPINHAVRTTVEYKLWRDEVFERDNHTCQICQLKGVYLQAHHIKRFSDFPELRFVVDNGVTLCRNCHQETKKKEEWWEQKWRYVQRLTDYQDELLWDTAR